MSKLEFLHLYPLGMSPCSLDKTTLAQAKETWLCSGCGAPKPLVGSVNVQIQEDCPEDSPLTFISGCGVIIARCELVNAFGVDPVKTNLLLGDVRGPAGELMSDWVTVRARHRVIVRGSKNISYRCCSECGRVVYFAMGTRYLFPAPPENSSIFETDLYGLLVSQEVFSRMTCASWPGLGVEKLRVLAKPKDSLGMLG